MHIGVRQKTSDSIDDDVRWQDRLITVRRIEKKVSQRLFTSFFYYYERSLTFADACCYLDLDRVKLLDCVFAFSRSHFDRLPFFSLLLSTHCSARRKMLISRRRLSEIRARPGPHRMFAAHSLVLDRCWTPTSGCASVRERQVIDRGRFSACHVRVDRQDGLHAPKALIK